MKKISFVSVKNFDYDGVNYIDKLKLNRKNRKKALKKFIKLVENK